ncbi:protein fmp42 [Anaeramoeba ignava]|uniref:Protein fmp42 n=1 Tax=Anaeramoeba ignava TaxID=1746090 RepID=A0A9Q0RHD3_ANAIG|nr:protein fmp42 [Anaeramoeba ignava]
MQNENENQNQNQIQNQNQNQNQIQNQIQIQIQIQNQIKNQIQNQIQIQNENQIQNEKEIKKKEMKKKEIPLIDFSQIQNKYNIIEMKFPLPEISSIILNTKLEEFFEELTTLCKTSLLLFINKSNNDKISLENEITPQNQSKIKFDQKISNLPKSCLYTKLIEICLEIFNNDSNEKSQNENSRNYILKENPGLQLYILKFFQILFEISKDPIFSKQIFFGKIYSTNIFFLF